MSLKVRAKALTVINAFALSRRALPALHTQGDALGYVLLGFQPVSPQAFLACAILSYLIFFCKNIKKRGKKSMESGKKHFSFLKRMAISCLLSTELWDKTYKKCQ